MLNRKPVIGLSCPAGATTNNHSILNVYLEAVHAAGGIALLLPAINSPEDTKALISAVDGILIPGGPDIDPFFYAEEPIPQLDVTRNSNDAFEIALLRAAREKKLPILGICRGEQVINVAFGGTLYQDINIQYSGVLKHRQADTCANTPTHSAFLAENTLIHEIYGSAELRVNSFHHQAIREPAPDFTVSARAKDGIIECIENADEKILGIQWHPEEMCQKWSEHLAPFRWLIDAACH